MTSWSPYFRQMRFLWWRSRLPFWAKLLLQMLQAYGLSALCMRRWLTILQWRRNSLPQPVALHFQTLFIRPVWTFIWYSMRYSLVSSGLNPLFRAFGGLRTSFFFYWRLCLRVGIVTREGTDGGEVLDWDSSVFKMLNAWHVLEHYRSFWSWTYLKATNLGWISLLLPRCCSCTVGVGGLRTGPIEVLVTGRPGCARFWFIWSLMYNL